MSITTKDRQRLLRLAEEQKQMALSEQNMQKMRLWYRHNSLKGEHPPVIIDTTNLFKEFCPPSGCETEEGRFVENLIYRNIIPSTVVGDDRVVPDYIPLPAQISFDYYGLKAVKKIYTEDSKGRKVGYKFEHPIKDLPRDIEILKPSEFYFNGSKLKKEMDLVNDTVGTVLQARAENYSLAWAAVTSLLIRLISMENFYFTMYDCPETLHRLMRFITDDLHRYISWQVENGLLTPTWGNYATNGASYCFTNELPMSSPSRLELTNGPTDIKPEDQWYHLNAQEMVGTSKEMFTEFVLPYYLELSSRFGLVYYGCCEPVHGIFEGCLDKIANMRKISVSPFCDEEKIAENLRGRNIIYSRKVNPTFISLDSGFDEEGFTAYIDKTLKIAKGLKLEFISREINTINGNTEKLSRSVRIIRERIEKLWQD